MVDMLLCALLWSTGGILIKLIPMSGAAIAGSRAVLSAAVVFIYMRLKRVKLLLNKKTAAIAVPLGLACVSFVMANKMTTAANAIALQYSAPVFILLYGIIVEKKPFRAGEVAVVGFTAFGIILFFLDKLGGGTSAGNAVALVSGILFAAMFVASGNTDESTRLSGVFEGQLVAAVCGLPFFFTADLSAMNTTGWIALIAVGIFQVGIPYILYAAALRDCPPLAASLISIIEPLCNPLWVFLFDGEAPGRLALLGGLIVIVAVSVWCVAGVAGEKVCRARRDH